MHQHNFGMGLGAIKSQANNAQFYIGLVQLGLVAVAAITKLQVWFPWMSFPMLLGILFVLYLILMLVDYKLVLPATLAFNSSQAWRHRSPMKVDTDILKADMKRLEGKIDRILENRQ